jgi:hypothetical protein
MTNRTTSSFSARTANSRVTPAPDAYVIRHRATTLPPPPATIPDRLSVCTEVDVGDSDPPNASMLSTSIRDLQASKCSSAYVRTRLGNIPFRLSKEDNAKVSVDVAAEPSFSHSFWNVTYVGVMYYPPISAPRRTEGKHHSRRLRPNHNPRSGTRPDIPPPLARHCWGRPPC